MDRLGQKKRNKISGCIRILIVDDEKRILETFSALLQDVGYYVRTAATKEEALAIIREDIFDIVFLDQFLGTTTGLNLMGRMTEVDPGLYYVIMTGHGNTDLAVESMKMGATDFIGKPFFVADLIKSIEFIRKRMEADKQKVELLAALESSVNEKTEELRGIYFAILSSLAQAMEKKDSCTYGHCKRVSEHSMKIALAMGIGEKEIRDLEAAATLHDIGKIGISDFVLGKKGPLDERETCIVRDHPAKGVEILRPVKQFGSILPVILHHHENYDGSGYPAGLSGEDIPVFSRIIAVADAYDAIISIRPYRSAANHESALEELFQCAGKQFDPHVVKAFERICAKGRMITG